MSPNTTSSPSGQVVDAARYASVREFSRSLCEPLSAEDCVIQSMPDVSPTRWHLAHTTWFFETFVLSQLANCRVFDANFATLFNSYYNSIGQQFPRSRRGLLSRPGLDEIMEYRRHVDQHMLRLLETNNGCRARAAGTIELGLQHERQHQELMLTDIKHVLSCNPLHPVYRDGNIPSIDSGRVAQWLSFDEGIYWIGHSGDSFAFDNESPRHRVFLDAFEMSRDLVSCGEYLQFIEDGGYDRSEFWLSLGWDAVRQHGWQAPLYWFQEDGRWHHFTLAGKRGIEPAVPVCHVSFFEADAFARWAGARLPRESEWEAACETDPAEGSFVEDRFEQGLAIHPSSDRFDDSSTGQFFGNVWEWTASPYVAYPGYQPPAGALGEYNGKFMCNQFVLRGGSCATSRDHIRSSYRNFFPPDARWQFSGLRLARDHR